ncbi:MAG: amidohydrolase family protein, partial [Chloroflexi bacterium]|nr:amidohydrolase family protein [Chloroflexota bacterium]
WLLHRLDEHYEWVGRAEFPELTKLPSEYFTGNCYLSVEADESPATYFIDRFGDDQLLFSTDYPHGDSKFPHAVDTFLAMPFSDATKKKILWDNCAKLYKLAG